ncbi:G-protein coupled receptor 98-like [Mizuhopecten yessoensis]|uniref:G-protein coupled receptor 98-like n=1 Tax=Mizuhopecten yessoensis TaxID=6573 RepID=UPI000B45ED1B|nr:G-protein coupled receptor 98-like [Mizuhopecten yessoensis]
MFHRIPTLGLCFTLCALSMIGTTQGTYMPVHCCSGSTLYGSRCVCNPGYHPDSTHRCVEPCWNKCKANTVCNKNTFRCYCKPGCSGNPYSGCAPPLSKFQFARSSYSVSESAGVAKLQIDRISGVSGRVTLYWKSTAISAKLNSDYKGASGTITFESNEKWKSIQIPIVNDKFYENTETFKVTLTSASSGGQVGPRRETVVTIRDDDLPGKFQFARSSYVVNENVGSVKLQIDRISGSLNQVTLYWKSTGISATLNSDYKGASGSITFGVGEKWKSIVIPIVNNQFFENTETFKVTLTTASSGGLVGPRRETVVTIKDDDLPGKFQFARSSYVVNENVGSVKLQIDRISGSLNQVTLYWKSTGISATLNSDYKGASGSITFGVGEKWKSIIIPIVNNQVGLVRMFERICF